MIDFFYRCMSSLIDARWRRQTTKLRAAQLKRAPSQHVLMDIAAGNSAHQARHRQALKVGTVYLLLALLFIVFMVLATM